MRAKHSSAGVTFALLAVALQVAVSALGGRLCYRDSPVPRAVECSIQCCDRDTALMPKGMDLGLQSLSSLPEAPSDSDCCLEATPEYTTPPTAGISLKHLDAAASAPMMLTASQPTRGSVAIQLRGPLDRAPQPPPLAPVIRTTVLLL